MNVLYVSMKETKFPVFSEVFPTRVGVNRAASMAQTRAQRIPHACGGEP